MNHLRDSGVMSGGPSAFSTADGRTFAAALDKFRRARADFPRGRGQRTLPRA